MNIVINVCIVIGVLNVCVLCYFLIRCKDFMSTYYSDDPSEHWEDHCEIHPLVEHYRKLFPCRECKCTCGKCECQKPLNETQTKYF